MQWRLFIRKYSTGIEQKKAVLFENILPVRVKESFKLDPEKGFTQFGLAKPVQRGITNMGWKYPSTAQLHAIPTIALGDNVILSAVAGNGKTGAYLIPLINKIVLDMKNKRLKKLLVKKTDGKEYYSPAVLIVVPTNELSTQVSAVANSLTKGIPWLRAFNLTGMYTYKQTVKYFRNDKIHICVSTPARFLEMLKIPTKENHFEVPEEVFLSVDQVHTIVLDECDYLYSFRTADICMYNVYVKWNLVSKFLDFFQPDHLKLTQKICVAALLPPKSHKNLANFAGNHTLLDINFNMEIPTNISQYFLKVDHNKKFFLLKYMLKAAPKDSPFNLENKRIMLLFRTNMRALKFEKLLAEAGIDCIVARGDKMSSSRVFCLQTFAEAAGPKILIATDNLSRGVDIPILDVVVNVDVPIEPECYVHRVGRCGRNGIPGTAITLVDREAFIGAVIHTKCIVYELGMMKNIGQALGLDIIYSDLPAEYVEYQNLLKIKMKEKDQERLLKDKKWKRDEFEGLDDNAVQKLLQEKKYDLYENEASRINKPKTNKDFLDENDIFESQIQTKKLLPPKPIQKTQQKPREKINPLSVEGFAKKNVKFQKAFNSLKRKGAVRVKGNKLIQKIGNETTATKVPRATPARVVEAKASKTNKKLNLTTSVYKQETATLKPQDEFDEFGCSFADLPFEDEDSTPARNSNEQKQKPSNSKVARLTKKVNKSTKERVNVKQPETKFINYDDE